MTALDVGAYGSCVSDAGTGTLTQSRARIERICQLGLDARTLRRQIVDELRRVVAFEAHAWLLTDPATAVGAAPVAEVPWMRELPRQIRLKYATRVNRWTGLGDTPVALLHETTHCWAFLELWRSGTAGTFTGAEAQFLADLVNPLTLALRRCQANAFVVRPPREQPRVGPVVLLLSPDLQVRSKTPQAQEYLRLLIPPVEDRVVRSPRRAAGCSVDTGRGRVEASRTQRRGSRICT